MLEFTLQEMSQALAALAVLVMVGAGVRRGVPLVRRLYLPNSVTAGILGLLLGSQVLGNVVDDGRLSEGLFGDTISAVWVLLPGLLINVVFATILLGKQLPGLPSIWRQSAPQVLFGATLSFGQYAVGIVLAGLVLGPLFDMSPLAGGLLEVSFTGGHGTAAGLSETMRDLGFEDGPDLALGLATVGLVSGILVGTLLINRAVRSDNIVLARDEEVEDPRDYDVDRTDLYDVPEKFGRTRRRAR